MFTAYGCTAFGMLKDVRHQKLKIRDPIQSHPIPSHPIQSNSIQLMSIHEKTLKKEKYEVFIRLTDLLSARDEL